MSKPDRTIERPDTPTFGEFDDDLESKKLGHIGDARRGFPPGSYVVRICGLPLWMQRRWSKGETIMAAGCDLRRIEQYGQTRSNAERLKVVGGKLMRVPVERGASALEIPIRFERPLDDVSDAERDELAALAMSNLVYEHFPLFDRFYYGRPDLLREFFTEVLGFSETVTLGQAIAECYGKQYIVTLTRKLRRRRVDLKITARAPA
jgi:hypothetical protein